MGFPPKSTLTYYTSFVMYVKENSQQTYYHYTIQLKKSCMSYIFERWGELLHRPNAKAR